MIALYWALVAWWNRPATWTRTPLRPTALGLLVFDVVTAAAALLVCAVAWSLFVGLVRT